MKKILSRDGVFGYVMMEFYVSELTENLNIMFYSENEYDPWEDSYECGCCKCCGCMCWMEGEDEDE